MLSCACRPCKQQVAGLSNVHARWDGHIRHDDESCSGVSAQKLKGRCSITLSTYPVCRSNGALHVAEGGKIELPSVCLALRLVHAAARHLRRQARALFDGADEQRCCPWCAALQQCRTLNSSIRSRTSFDSMFLGRFPRSMENTGGGGGSGTALCMHALAEARHDRYSSHRLGQRAARATGMERTCRCALTVFLIVRPAAQVSQRNWGRHGALADCCAFECDRCASTMDARMW